MSKTTKRIDTELLEKIEMAHDWLGHHKGQGCNIRTLLDNWAVCGEILEQILGEIYEKQHDKED